MDTRQAYNEWASQYDKNDNKTRDLEALALRECLGVVAFNDCLEIGCGTGKNTVWFAEKAKHVTAVDLSDEMLARARLKVVSQHVDFKQGDILSGWNFGIRSFDLVTFSLVLEHVEHLEKVFKDASETLKEGGHLYVGELHPFKQYTGSKARFTTEHGTQVVECFNHHISDFISAGKKYALQLIDVNEYFDDDDRNGVPRILTILFRKV